MGNLLPRIKVFVARSVAPAERRKKTPSASARTEGPALLCRDINEWLRPECRAYRALLVQRPQHGRDDIQQEVDEFAKSGGFGGSSSAEEEVELQVGTAKQHLELDLSKKARRLAAYAVQQGLPKDLGCQIEQDLEEIALVLTKLVPTAKKAVFKLEIMGEQGCSRWHRDNTIGRAIVTYNSCGTQYVDNAHVNLEQLDNRAANEAIVRDESQACFANVGDILLMKSMHFPGAIKGLVHKSPQPFWHADGTVVNRLLLKVDMK